MKRPISPAYTFTPGSSTLNLSGISSFAIGNLFAVINLKTGALLYAPLAGYGYSALSGTTLTLTASMAGMNAADPLMIIYDDGGKPAEDATLQSVVTGIATLITDVANNHGDLQTLHSDLSTTLHADLAALLSKLGSSPAQSSDVAAIVTRLGAAPAQDATVGQAVTVLGNLLTALGLLATETDVQATTAKVEAVRGLLAGTIRVDPSAVTAPISAASLPLPSGAATETTLSTIKSILAAQASIAESTWYDPTVTPNLFYFRRVTNTDGVVTEIFTDPNGTQVTFNANWKPLGSTSSYQVLPAVSYDCKTAATGMSVDDVIVRVIILNLGVQPATIAASMWLNANTGAVLSSVTMANLKEVTRDISIPDGYDVTFGAQADQPVALPTATGSFMSTFRGYWTDFRARIPALGTALMIGSSPVTLATDDKAALALGGVADAAATADTGSFSLVALIKRSLARWTTLLALLPASLGAKTSALSFPVTISTDTTLAQDGNDATGVTMPTGGAGIRGWLSGIFNALGLRADAPAATPAASWSLIGGLGGLWAYLAGILGTTADAAAASSASTTATIFGWIKRFSANDDTALAAISTTATREGALGSSPPTMPTGASGKLGALQGVWERLISLVTLFSNTKTTAGTLSTGAPTLTLVSGPNGTTGFKLTGTPVGAAVSAFATTGDGVYDVPMSIRTFGANSVSSTTVSAAGLYWVEGPGSDGVQLQFAATSGSFTVGSVSNRLHKSMRIHAPVTDPAYVALSIAGAIMSATNALFVQPAASALFAIAGLVSAADPTLTAGASAQPSLTTSGRLRVDTGRFGVGGLLAIPGYSSVGTPLGTPPATYKGVELWIPNTGSLSATIQSTQPTAAPVDMPFPNATGTGMIIPIDLSQADGQLVYITALSGACRFRWI